MGYFLNIFMLRALFSAVLVSALAFLHVSGASAASVYGTHPYDQPHRIIRGTSAERNSGTWGYKAIVDFERSPYRTTTHMLHPYFRSDPYNKYLARDIRRIHPFISIHSWEQYELGGWSF